MSSHNHAEQNSLAVPRHGRRETSYRGWLVIADSCGTLLISIDVNNRVCFKWLMRLRKWTWKWMNLFALSVRLNRLKKRTPDGAQPWRGQRALAMNSGRNDRSNTCRGFQHWQLAWQYVLVCSLTLAAHCMAHSFVSTLTCMTLACTHPLAGQEPRKPWILEDG